MRPPAPGPRRNFFAKELAFGCCSSKCLWMSAINPSIFRQSSTSTRNCTKARFSPSGTVDKHEAQTAAADERRDMGDAGQTLDVPLGRTGERLRFADVGAGRQEDVHHELRPGRGREEALLDHGEAVE